MENEIKKAIDIIKSRLSEKRFNHSMNVARQAKMLGEIYGEDTKKLYFAGVVHDICKEISYDEQLKVINSGGIYFDKYVMTQQKVWHAIAGSVFIQKELGITDEQIIDAVRYHTTGKQDMDTFSKIIYIADITSEERDYPKVDLVRKYAKEDLDKAMLMSLEFTINKLMGLGKMLNEDTVLAYNQCVLKKAE